MRDDVDEFAAPYGVVHDMAMRAHPHRAFRNGNVARHRASGRHPAPADTAGESWCVRAEQALPHNRMNAVRSEEHTSELQSLRHLVCRPLLEKKKITQTNT